VDGNERAVAGRPSDASDVRLVALPKPKSQNLPPVDGGSPNGPT
jgi:hypothetical protein